MRWANDDEREFGDFLGPSPETVMREETLRYIGREEDIYANLQVHRFPLII